MTTASSAPGTLTPVAEVRDLPRLTSLRALAAGAVFLYHFARTYEWMPAQALWANGFAGVAFFFILSGFVLTWSAGRTVSAPDFWLRRVSRVYPSHLLMVLVALLVPVTAFPITGRGVIANGLLVQAWFPDWRIVFGANAVSWSLSCEAFFYLIAPFLIVWSRSKPTAALVTVCLGWLALMSAVAVAAGYTSDYLDVWAYTLPIVRSGEFVLGILLATLVLRGWRPRLPLPLALALAAALAVVLTRVKLPQSVVDVVFILPFAVVIVAAAVADIVGRKGLLRLRWLVYAGQVSFGFYLVHELVLLNLSPWVGTADRGLVVNVGRGVGLFTVAVACAVALHEFVEKPAQRQLRSRLPQRLVLRLLGVPTGMGALFTRRGRLTLVLGVLGSAAVASLEVLAIAAVMPLMQLLSGVGVGGGVFGRVAAMLGNPPDERLAAYLAAIMIALFTVKALATVAFRWWISGFIMREQVGTAMRLLRYYLRAPYSLHLRRNTADLLVTLSDGVGQTYGQVVTGAMWALSDAITIVAILVTLFVSMPLPTLGVTLYFTLAAVIFQRWARPHILRASTTALWAAQGSFQSGTEAIAAVKEVQVRGVAPYFERRYRESRLAASQAGRITGFLGDAPKHLLELLFIIGIALLAGLAYRQDTGTNALSMIALFAAAGFRILPSVVRLMASLNAIRAGSVGVNRVLADLGPASRVPDQDPRVVPLPFNDAIRVADVSFRYEQGNDDVLRGVTLEIPFGRSVALVGGSGAGKSTLVDVLLGLLPPAQGTVTVDGVDIADHMAAWRLNIGMVPQSVWMVEGSLADNIAFGEASEGVDTERLALAVHQADLDEVVEHLPHGIATEIGERGVRLSGGQRQRIGIARALYRNPRLLVLDEATSALDNETERRITQTITSLQGRMAMVIVAHRLSTVKHCDQVAFIKDGRVEALGTFAEVQAASPDFARQVQLGRLE